jgi:transposase-like protein
MSDLSMKPMSQAAYVAAGGNLCPYCGSTDISGGSFTVDGPTAHQEVSCSECDEEWTDTYTLAGFQRA